MQTFDPRLTDIQFFSGMRPEHLGLIAGCATHAHYEPRAVLGRAGEPADRFWVVREGRLGLEMRVPGRGAITIATVGHGDVVGFSWLLPPHDLRFDVRALAPTRALVFDGRCLRAKCVADPGLGYELLSRFSRLMAERLEAMGLQLLDVYGDVSAENE